MSDRQKCVAQGAAQAKPLWHKDIPESIVSGSCLFETAANKEQLRQILGQLSTLKEPYREVFQLRIFGQLPFRQIADIFGKTESWAKVTFYRAKGQLLKKWREHHEE